MTDTDDATRATLQAALAAQRQAYRADPVPSLAARRQHLRALQAFVRDHQQALCDAISAD